MPRRVAFRAVAHTRVAAVGARTGRRTRAYAVFPALGRTRDAHNAGVALRDTPCVPVPRPLPENHPMASGRFARQGFSWRLMSPRRSGARARVAPVSIA